MVAAYSPHRDGGGTLHFLPSPTHIHHVDPSSALAQLRRSLSRSPSRGPTFRLVTSKSTIPSPSSPLSLSPSSPSLRITPNTGSPLAVPFPPSARKIRSSARRPSPMRTSTHLLTANRSPAKRALVESSDNGNASPPSSHGSSSGAENENESEIVERRDDIERLDVFGKPNVRCLVTSVGSRSSENLLNPNKAFAKKDRQAIYFADIGAKSSPLKRSDGSMNLDLSQLGSPSAKRRSLHGAAFGPDFDIFDAVAAKASENQSADTNASEEPTYPQPAAKSFSPLPKRSSSLRKTTLQQRHEKPLFKSKPSQEMLLEFDSPAQARGRQRMSMDAVPQPSRDSPFSSQGSLPSASVHPMPYHRKEPFTAGGQMLSQRHPLSRTLTQSSSDSSLAESSPSHAPVRQTEFRKPSSDFSKSLPLHAAKPAPAAPSSTEASSQATSFATPESYKFAKPLPTAFMSTGLISKRNKNLDDAQLDLRGSIGHMPDTPCKRPLSLAAISPFTKLEAGITKPRPSRHTLHSFGTPSTPFNPHVARPSVEMAHGTSIFGSGFGNGNASRRGSFLSVDGEDYAATATDKIDSQSSAEFDIPPTPTKQVSGHDFAQSRVRFDQPDPVNLLKVSVEDAAHEGPAPLEMASSPLLGASRDSPRTPSENMLPPDPSGLSISVPPEPHAALANNGSGLSSLFPPATPTANRDGISRFGKHRASITPVHHILPAEVDTSITYRFEKAELVGLGEFSQVFRVGNHSEPGHDGLAGSGRQFSPTPRFPDQVWAVKKSRQPYLGPKDRRRKLKEVEILKALGQTDHTIQFFDSWEHHEHLYIQTEFCEEGSLDLFLAQAGRTARLDDFRIWKILLEVSLGLKHIHDHGIIHLDLKPANVLITFEGVLKIGDFGMATFWPAEAGIEGEGDREYIGPEILMGKYDKPADVFALGMMMLEIAANVMLPDNGVSWQRLRRGDMSDVPSLTTSSATSVVSRDSSGKPISRESTFTELSEFYETAGELDYKTFFDLPASDGKSARTPQPPAQRLRAGELHVPPAFMVDPSNEQALDKVVRWMISPDPSDRPIAGDLFATSGVSWVEARRRAGATIYEGHWGPADEVLQDDAEMIDV